MQVSSTQHGENSKLRVNEVRIVLDRPKDHAAMLTSLQGFDHLWNVTSVVSHGNIWDPVTNPNGSKIAQYASTAMVARDLVELAERHGQWREKQARIKHADQKAMHRLRWNRGEEPLLVSMLSYGTLLGSTLAAMQPHRVHRFHLDGVVDATEYFAGQLNGDAVDSDLVVEKFFEYCALAEPDDCPMWAGNSSIDTRRRLEDIYTGIRLNGPVAVPRSMLVGPDIITLSDVKKQVRNLLYSPLTNWSKFARMIAPLTERNGTAFAAYKQDKWEQLPKAFDPEDPATAPMNSWASEMIQGGETSARLSQAEFRANTLGSAEEGYSMDW
jgi:pimeloyl-ACP methyl ester carboxylesterase